MNGPTNETKKLQQIQKEQGELEQFAGEEIRENACENMERLSAIFGKSADLKTLVYEQEAFTFGIAYLDGIINKHQLEETVIEPLIVHQQSLKAGGADRETLIENLISPAAVLSAAFHYKQLLESLLNGSVLLFIDGLKVAYTIPLEYWPYRSIEEPQTQTMVKGPREGFIESLQINMTLLRRRIATPSLHFLPRTIGNVTRTKLLVCYMEKLVDRDVLNKLLVKIDKIKTDKVFDTGMLEELLEEKRFTPFPAFQSTERPDVAAAAIAEGKVVIMMEGTPFAIIVPATFWSFFQAAEDYYNHFDLATFIRFIRLISYIIALALPASYIAVTTFHQELIPPNLLVSLAAQREGVPFPAFLEALLMELIFEILREAGIRMPRPIGSAVSIVGAIVIGESAVAAGLVSPAIVIVVSLTAIASFVSPYYSFSGTGRLLRFILMILASTLGIYGMIMFMIALAIHLSSLQTFGVPYFEPFAPFKAEKQKDSFLRFPLWWTQTAFYLKYRRKLESGKPK
ncbi:spore germination protein [Metabacillus sp. SLBN-84]